MGISRVYYVEPYSGISYKHVMSDGPKERRPVQELFTGALGRAYTQLYTPVLPQKDELALWIDLTPGTKSGESLAEATSTQSDGDEKLGNITYNQEAGALSESESKEESAVYHDITLADKRVRKWKKRQRRT